MDKKTLIFLAVVASIATFMLCVFTPPSRVFAQSSAVKKKAAIAAVAQTVSKQISLQWEQPEPRQPVAGWTVYMSEVSGGVPAQKIDVLDTDGKNPVVSTQTFSISGDAGTKVRRYIVVDAFDAAGYHTPKSNEVYFDVDIPGGINAPINLTITLIVEGR